MSEKPRDRVAGRVLGGFRIVRILGEGRFGSVFEAEDATADRRVALEDLTLRILDAPVAAHRQGVVHGALEPGVLVLPPDDSDARILELGLHELRARAGKLAAAWPDIAAERGGATEAPRDADDLDAVARLLDPMLSGVLPAAVPRAVRLQRPQVPAALDRVVVRALAGRENERFPDAVSFAAALRAVELA